MKGNKIPYSFQEVDFIKKNSFMNRKQLTEKFNTRFGRTLNYTNIQSLCSRERWLTPSGGRYTKGCVSMNKGKKIAYNSNSAKHWFKKGSKPHNSKPVGSRIFRFGYWVIKIAEPNVWIEEHRKIYQECKGVIPKGKLVVFKDGNSRNLNIENLDLIDRALHAAYNTSKNRNIHPKLRQEARLLTKLNHKIKKR